MESTRVATGITIHNEQRGRRRAGVRFLTISWAGDAACSCLISFQVSLVHSNYLKSEKVAERLIPSTVQFRVH